MTFRRIGAITEYSMSPTSVIAVHCTTVSLIREWGGRKEESVLSTKRMRVFFASCFSVFGIVVYGGGGRRR